MPLVDGGVLAANKEPTAQPSVTGLAVDISCGAARGEQAMPLKRLKNDHRVTTWRGVEFWKADEAGSLVFCRIDHEALRDQAKRTHFEGADVKVFEVYQDLLEQVASDAASASNWRCSSI